MRFLGKISKISQIQYFNLGTINEYPGFSEQKIFGYPPYLKYFFQLTTVPTRQKYPYLVTFTSDTYAYLNCLKISTCETLKPTFK